MRIIGHFAGHPRIEVGILLSNKPDSPAIAFASSHGIPVINATNQEVADSQFLLNHCREYKINYIVLAGYLRLVPPGFIAVFADKIFNIHPSLLPKYGGKGMYGDHVHRAVLANQEPESGITVHLVNEVFDEGQKLAQFYCKLEKDDDLVALKKKIQLLEHAYFAVVIEKYLLV